ncbi:MAG: hypothetical protein V3W41_10855 [Planctomycetota bacterium]
MRNRFRICEDNDRSNEHRHPSQAGERAEVDLVLENSDRKKVIAVEIKRTLAPKLGRGFTESVQTIGATKGYVVIPKGEAFPLAESVTAMSSPEFLGRF